MAIFERNIGLNKGKRRLWLEGAVLTENGINHGHRFDVVSNGDNHLVIHINPDGKRKIAGKPARPIIDMSAATITNAFNDSIKRVTVQPISNGLVITGIR
jgi:DNA (cytosine-5)-methyltransferase 1